MRLLGPQPRFNTPTLALMAVAIAINIAVGHTVQNVIKLPVYLDSIGTVLVGALAGPLAGALTGILSNVIWGLGLGVPSIIPYALTAGAIGLLAGSFGMRGVFAASRAPRSALWCGVAGVVTGVVAAVISAPITVLQGGVTGSGTDALVIIFRNITENVFLAAQFQGLVSDPVDKLVTFLVCFALLLAVPVTTKTAFPQGERTI